MANDVFANGREISCKSADGKAIAAFPDVCFTPPENPATPPGVPIPYPNTGVAKDTTAGSKSVQVTGKEVMLKNKSYFKKSSGDEAGSAAKKGVLTSVNRGKVYFNSWSMDVTVEGQNVVRHFDLTTHNHMSFPGNTPTWPYLDTLNLANLQDCMKDIQKEQAACQQYAPAGTKDPCADAQVGTAKPSRRKRSRESMVLAAKTASNACLAARRCILQPYHPNQCCYPQTPHHLIEASALHNVGRGKTLTRKSGGVRRKVPSLPLEGVTDYNEDKAPCVCAEGPTQNVGTHGLMHTFQSENARKAPSKPLTFSDGSTKSEKSATYAEGKKSATDAVEKVFPDSACSSECLVRQLDNYHNQCGVDDNTDIKAVATGQTDLDVAQGQVEDLGLEIKRRRLG